MKHSLTVLLVITLLYEDGKPHFVQDILIENHINYIFTPMFMKESNGSFWGRELLGVNMLTSNQQVIVTLKSGKFKNCLYDIRTVFINGGEMLFQKIDICFEEHINLFEYDACPSFGFE